MQIHDDSDDESLDFGMLEVPTLSAVQSASRRAARSAQNAAASHAYVSAQANGATPADAHKAAQRAAGRVVMGGGL